MINPLIEPTLILYIHMNFSKKTTPPTDPLHVHSKHSTYLFKILFSLLTLSTAFLQKAGGPAKIHSFNLYNINK